MVLRLINLLLIQVTLSNASMFLPSFNAPSPELQLAIEEDLKTLGIFNPSRHLQTALDDELQFCYDALYIADENKDGQLDRQEFLDFVEGMGGPAGVSDFNNLPRVFRSTFIILACKCTREPNAARDCCVGDKASLPIAGTGPGEVPSSAEEQDLYHICFLSESSVVKYDEESKPTMSPAINPTQSPANPTPNPSTSPDVFPSPSPITPTPEPTRSPTTFVPTKSPSAKPSGLGTASPTVSPIITPSPTESTSNGPIGAPTVIPTLSPTPVPTAVPTLEPTVAPTITPTLAPTITPQPSSPSNSPSVKPTKSPPDALVLTNYIIAVKDNAPFSSYQQDLISSMDILAPQVADKVDGDRRLRGRRQLLSVSVDRPTSVEGRKSVECPDTVSNESDRCENVTSAVGLFVDEAEDIAEVAESYKEDLTSSILEGGLQEALDFVNEDSVIYIVTGLKKNPIDPNGDSTLSTGAISGIVVVGLIGLVLIGGLLSRRSRGGSDVDLKQDDYLVDMQGIAPNASEEIGGKGKKQGSRDGKRSDESSHAGSSGWSSQGGMSSLDTTSMDMEDESNRNVALGGAALAGAVVAGAVGRTASSSQSENSQGNNLQMTYSELDDAIQKGDWAAVGVTAALLASQSYETSGSGASKQLSLNNATLNPSRAAELDRLVEAGDWEGVVAAAAKFDAQEATHQRISGGSSLHSRSSSRSSSGSTPGNSGSVGSGSGSGTRITAGGVSTGSTGSGARKLSEIREEVEGLVKQVVPEEQDNVDEMMMQFQGREEELVETLRSMQERQIANKARVEGQKRAKRDAKDQVEAQKAAIPTEDQDWMDDVDKGALKLDPPTDLASSPDIMPTPNSKRTPPTTDNEGGEESSEEERRKRREQQLKEEQEALEQANMWSAIAQQTQASSSNTETDAAAQDATDWAIARSLSDMSTPNENKEDDDDDEEGSV